MDSKDKKHRRTASIEYAEQIFNEICDYWEFEIDTNDDDSNRIKDLIIGAISYGRLLFDEDTEEFLYTLRNPIDVDVNEGMQIREFKLVQPTAAELRNTLKGVKSQNDINGFYNSAINKLCKTLRTVDNKIVPLYVVDRIKRKDFTIIQAINNFFE